MTLLRYGRVNIDKDKNARMTMKNASQIKNHQIKNNILFVLVALCICISCQSPKIILATQGILHCDTTIVGGETSFTKAILANKDICYYDTVITSQEMFFDATKYDSQFLKVRLTIPSTRDYFDKNTVSLP